MATSVANTHIQTFMVSINPNDKRATKLVEALKLMDFITIEKSPYDPEFVDKIKRSEKSKKHIVDVAKMWD